MMRFLMLVVAFVLLGPVCFAQTLTGSNIQVEVDAQKGQETLEVKIDGAWKAALGASAAVHVRMNAGISSCTLTHAASIDHGLLLSGDCSTGKFEQRLMLTPEPDVLDVVTRFFVPSGADLSSVEDRYDFLPEKHTHVDAYNGPLDFVWSQNIKSEADDLIPVNSFKSPALILQQGRVLASVMPHLNLHHEEVRALDLDVTSDKHPWIAYGAIPSEPHDHSYFRRAPNVKLTPIGGTVEYSYSIVLSDQPPKQGYRRIVARLWSQLGHLALLQSADAQENVLRPELASFDSWRQDAWHTYADRVYQEFACGTEKCATLRSDRNVLGQWDHPEADAWFNAWFQTLRTAYGWYLHGRDAHDPVMMSRAEKVLNLALSSPQQQGAFSTIYLVDQGKWAPSDGWAGYADSYHAFSMSWTGYWLLRWAQDLTPDRKPEILRFARAYGDFLLAHQQASGVIPSWYYADTLRPREEFREFNAEAAPSALFLATLGSLSGEPRFTEAAERAMDFVVREVAPRERWFDFETYLSCARKDYSFFDRWTAQYPQNNLAEIQAPAAMLALYRATHKARYLRTGTAILDYLLLAQQVWNPPSFTPKLLGGFTTQNTDQEWSDARQGYAATVLADYYEATGRFEYLERAIAAARSTFAVAPWENWAHTGYADQPGALTGFHWGTGSAMTSVEIMAPRFGDALIDVGAKQGAGFDQCTIRDVTLNSSNIISFWISSPAPTRRFLVRFRGLHPGEQYQIRWNGHLTESLSGDRLSKNGLEIGPIGE